MHAKQVISKSQLHIKLHYTWSDDISEKHITILDHMHFEEKNVEMVLARVIFRGLQIAILNLYAALHATFPNIINVVSNALHHLHLNTIIIILGDFNVDMLQNSAITKELENYMCNYNIPFWLLYLVVFPKMCRRTGWQTHRFTFPLMLLYHESNRPLPHSMLSHFFDHDFSG
jgi:hypothetical protein